MEQLQQLTEEQLSAARKIEKLMRLAGSPNEAEATSAVAKWQALLAQHNLSMAQVQGAGGDDGRREQAKQRGGALQYQRALWRTVAELNFCLCFVVAEWTKYPRPHVRAGRAPRTHGYTTAIKLVGRRVNVAATTAMATHLLQTVDRLCMERLHGDTSNRQFLSRWAVSWREGVAERVRQRLVDRRKQQLSAEEEKRRSAAKAAMAAGSTASALTLTDVKRQEKDLNTDFMNGLEPGTTARERAADAAAAVKKEQEYVLWAKAHPEQVRAKEAKAAEESRKYWARYRGGGGRAERDKDWSAYKDGFAKGDGVSLDQQAEHQRAKGALGHG